MQDGWLEKVLAKVSSTASRQRPPEEAGGRTGDGAKDESTRQAVGLSLWPFEKRLEQMASDLSLQAQAFQQEILSLANVIAEATKFPLDQLQADAPVAAQDLERHDPEEVPDTPASTLSRMTIYVAVTRAVDASLWEIVEGVAGKVEGERKTRRLAAKESSVGVVVEKAVPWTCIGEVCLCAIMLQFILLSKVFLFFDQLCERGD